MAYRRSGVGYRSNAGQGTADCVLAVVGSLAAVPATDNVCQPPVLNDRPLRAGANDLPCAPIAPLERRVARSRELLELPCTGLFSLQAPAQ